MLSPGTRVDRYIIEAHIGQGGMAAVYRVRHATLGTRHALKVLQISNRDVRERTIQEGQVQARLRHPHIVSVTDVLEVDGLPGLLMEFVRGPALDHWLYQYQPSIEEALVVFRGVVAGVGHAHSKGLVHRDLKSANIMLQVDDELGVIPKVTDFGLAKVSRPDGRKTRSGTTMGTPTFMAPEQIRDASTVDRRADLYSLGCILYELVCGRTPHVGDDILQLFSEVATGDYPHPREFRPDVPNHVVDCIEALVDLEPRHRLSDCAAILEILDGGPNPFTGPILGELGPPRPMPEVPDTILAHGSPGGVRAALFLTQLSTPPMVLPDDPGSMAPIDADFDGHTRKIELESPQRSTRQARLGILALVAMTGPVAVAIGLTIGLLVLGLGLWSRHAEEAIVTADPIEHLVVPVPIVVPELEPQPVPVEPTPVEPVERPAPLVVPRVNPTRPRPSERPSPAPPSPEPAATGGFSVRGAAGAVLVGGNMTYRAGQAVPPGKYQILAEFTKGATPVAAGRVTIRAGQEVVLACDPAFGSCKGR